LFLHNTVAITVSHTWLNRLLLFILLSHLLCDHHYIIMDCTRLVTVEENRKFEGMFPVMCIMHSNSQHFKNT